MKEGLVEHWEAGINTACNTILLLAAAGQKVEHAVEAARILTLQSVKETLEEKLGNRSASEINHSQARETAQAPTPTPQPQAVD
jgi:hypothetical protein